MRVSLVSVRGLRGATSAVPVCCEGQLPHRPTTWEVLVLRLKSLMRRRPSAAIVISSIALFMSLGGVGYAATQIANNSVGTAQLKNNAVTNSKIKNDAVSYKKIQARAVGTVRANLNQLQARVSRTCAAGTA